jgi:hypothetical protein
VLLTPSAGTRIQVLGSPFLIFTRLEKGPHHDGVRFANKAEVTLQELGPGVKGYLCDALLSPSWHLETVDTV